MVPDNATPADLDDQVDDAFEQAIEQVRLWTEYNGGDATAQH